jgi:hypothetical protein
MANLVFSDDGEHRSGMGTAAWGLPLLCDDNDLPVTIGVPSTARGKPINKHQ